MRPLGADHADPPLTCEILESMERKSKHYSRWRFSSGSFRSQSLVIDSGSSWFEQQIRQICGRTQRRWNGDQIDLLIFGCAVAARHFKLTFRLTSMIRKPGCEQGGGGDGDDRQ
jgi:hypothetical protein